MTGWTVALGTAMSLVLACNNGDSGVAQSDEPPPGIGECYRYVDNVAACMATAALDPVGLDRDEICSKDTYTTFNQKSYWCMANVYEDADCNSLGGLAEAGDAAQMCNTYEMAPPAGYCCPARFVDGSLRVRHTAE